MVSQDGKKWNSFKRQSGFILKYSRWSHEPQVCLFFKPHLEGNIMDDVQTTYPPESAGPLAQARFFYQHQYIAYWCIQMLGNKDIDQIICEHHDDLLVRWKSGQYYFMQVKTRTEGEGEWTLAKLFETKNQTENSIIEKLYDKKCQFGRDQSHLYFFVSDMGSSNGGKPIGLHTLKNLNGKGRNSWNDEEKKDFTKIVGQFGKKLRHERLDQIDDFCSSLNVETWHPGKQSIRAFNISKLQEVIKLSFGVDLPYQDLNTLYEGILKIVRDANIVEDEAVPLARTVEQKTIQRQQIEGLIKGFSSSKIYLERVEPAGTDSLEENAEVTKLEQKTFKVGFDPDSILHLKEMRASANYFYRQYRHVGSARKRLEQLSMQVQRICVKVKNEGKSKNLDGIEQWLLLDKYLNELSEQDQKQANFPPVEVDYLFGEVGNLTGKCKIHWGSK